MYNIVVKRQLNNIINIIKLENIGGVYMESENKTLFNENGEPTMSDDYYRLLEKNIKLQLEVERLTKIIVDFAQKFTEVKK